MIPPDIAEQLKAMTLYEVAVVGIFIVALIWGVWKAGAWVITRLFPGLVAGAKAVVNGAQILAAVKDLPEFIQRTDASQTAMQASQTAMQAQIAEIHHEVNFNNGSSVKDAVVRVERTAERLEEGVKGLHGRMDTVETGLTHVKSEIGELRAADDALREDLENTNNPLTEDTTHESQ